VGKHWEFDSDSETEELQLQQTLPPVKKKKLPKKAPPKKVASSETDSKRKKKSVHVEESDDEEAKEKEKEKEKPKPPKQLPKKRKTAFTEELIGDYKGILARKRMASLNASAIVAATYEVERHLDKNLASDCSSFESYDELDTMPTTTSKVTSAAAIKTEVIHIKKEPKESKESLRERERERESERRRERDNELKDSTVGKMSSHSIIEESNDSKYSKETKETNTDTTITTTGYRDSAATRRMTRSQPAKQIRRPRSRPRMQRDHRARPQPPLRVVLEMEAENKRPPPRHHPHPRQPPRPHLHLHLLPTALNCRRRNDTRMARRGPLTRCLRAWISRSTASTTCCLAAKSGSTTAC